MQFDVIVAALEGKIVQRAVLALLNAIYEEDFLGISYGFRPGRGTHDALDAVCVGIDSRKVSWIVDADIRSFFDEISQEWLTRFLEHRIGDRRIIRLIQKWLKAGVLEAGAVSVSDKGTGQDSVISPLLANIYLHYALDLWAVRWRRREATGDMVIVRYAEWCAHFIGGARASTDAARPTLLLTRSTASRAPAGTVDLVGPGRETNARQTYAARPAMPCCLPADDRGSTRRLPPLRDRGTRSSR